MMAFLRTVSRSTSVAAPVVLGLAAVDVFVTILARPPAFANPGVLFGAFAIDIVLVAAIYLAGTLLAMVVARRTRLPASGWGVTIAIPVWLTLVAAGPSNTYFAYYDCQPDTVVCAPYFLKAGLLCLALVPGLYAVLRRFAASSAADTAGNALRLRWSTPFALVAFATTQWVLVYALDQATASQVIVAIAACVVTVMAITAVMGRLRNPNGLTAAAMLVFVFVGASWNDVAAGSRAASRMLRSLVGIQKPAVPHVLFISIDSLRADAVLRARGGSLTPSIDRVAAEAVVFSRTVSPASWTMPAVASWMTGVSPLVHQFHTHWLAPRLPSLPDRLRSAGYATAAVVGNYLLDSPANISRGFDHFEALLPPGETKAEPRPLSVGARVHTALRLGPDHKATTAGLTDAALDWLKGHRGDPTFLWLHYMDPHGPYEPPAEWHSRPEPSPVSPAGAPPGRDVLGSQQHRLYEAEVRYVDAHVGRLLDAMKQAGTYDDTLVVVTSDHGEEFGEHGGQFHARTLYQESISVPLIIKLPRQRTPRRIETRVSTLGLMATILDVCAIPYDSKFLESESLLGLLAGKPEGPPRPTMSWLPPTLPAPDGQCAIIDGDVKYIRWESGREELYDLQVDPGERLSLARVRPVDLERARRTLSASVARQQRLREYYSTNIRVGFVPDAEQRRRLKALGYVQ